MVDDSVEILRSCTILAGILRPSVKAMVDARIRVVLVGLRSCCRGYADYGGSDQWPTYLGLLLGRWPWEKKESKRE
jgi:hypothetical protein